MASDDLCLLDLVEIGRRVQARQLTSVEVTQAVLDRIARLDGRLKSYVTLTTDLALAQAAQADAEVACGAIRGPLHGVPIAVKDLCNSKGILTSAGMTIHKDHRPERDATVVARLREAGAVLLGKLKLTEGRLLQWPRRRDSCGALLRLHWYRYAWFDPLSFDHERPHGVEGNLGTGQ